MLQCLWRGQSQDGETTEIQQKCSKTDHRGIIWLTVGKNGSGKGRLVSGRSEWVNDRYSMLSCFSHVQPFVILWAVTGQSSLSMGFSRQEHWSGLPLSPPGDLLTQGSNSHLLTSSALAGGFFTTSITWEACLLSQRLAKNQRIDDTEILTNRICHRATFLGQTSGSP